MVKREIRGYLYILIGTTLWGISSVVAKSLFNIGLPPAELVLIRLTLATLTLLLILFFFDRKRIIISPKDFPYFFILGFAAYIVLGEVLYPLQILGGIGVIAAVVLLQIGREKTAPSTPLEIRKKE